MTLQSKLNQETIEALPIIHAIIGKAEPFEKNQMTSSVLSDCMNSNKSIVDMNSEELLEFQLDCIKEYEVKGWLSLDDLTVIERCSVAHFCSDESTVEVVVTDLLGKTETFYVQTVDLKYRRDLGDLILSGYHGEDTEQGNYPLISFNSITTAAEKYIASQYEVVNVKADIYTKTNGRGECEILRKNASFVNSDTSSYQKEFEKSYGVFDSESEACDLIGLAFDSSGNLKSTENCSSLDELVGLICALDNLGKKQGDNQHPHYDSTDFPVFGKNPEDVNDIFSWDDESVLLYGTTLENNGWYTEARCKVCGEATFNCEHDEG